MYRKFAAAFIVASVALGVAMADEFNATVKKVDKGEVTYFKKAKKGEEPKDVTLPAATDIKVNKGKSLGKGKYEVGDAITDGLKNEVFTKIDSKKGLSVRIITDKDNKSITQILVLEPKKKAE